MIQYRLEVRSDAMRRVVNDSFPDSPVFIANLIEVNDEPSPLLVDAAKLQLTGFPFPEMQQFALNRLLCHTTPSWTTWWP